MKRRHARKRLMFPKGHMTGDSKTFSYRIIATIPPCAECHIQGNNRVESEAQVLSVHGIKSPILSKPIPRQEKYETSRQEPSQATTLRDELEKGAI